MTIFVSLILKHKVELPLIMSEKKSIPELPNIYGKLDITPIQSSFAKTLINTAFI